MTSKSPISRKQCEAAAKRGEFDAPHSFWETDEDRLITVTRKGDKYIVSHYEDTTDTHNTWEV